MQFVSDRLYAIYNRVAVIIGCGLALACILTLVLPAYKDIGMRAGLSPIILVTSLCLVIYGVFLYRHQANKSAWMAALISSMLMSLNSIALMHASGKLHSPWLALWAAVVLTSSMFGLYASAGAIFLITLYFVLETPPELLTSDFDVLNIAPVLGTIIGCIISYLIWRPRYIDSQSRKLNQLTGMVRNKQIQTEILIESIADGIIAVDTEGKITLMNQAAAKITGWKTDEASNLDARNVLSLADEKSGTPLSREQHPFTLVFSQKKPALQTLQLASRDKKRVIVSLVTSPVLVPKSQELAGAVAVFRDVSTERQEEQRRADFISTASHEMRTPVAAIEGYLALALNDKVSNVDTKAREFLNKAHSSTQSLGKLFQDLLTSAKAEDGRLTSHPVVVEMGAYMEQLVDDLKFSAQKKNLLTEFVFGTSGSVTTIDASGGGAGKVVKPLYYIHADPDRLREVITNLFDNAVKYTESGKISIGLTGDDHVVQVSIADTGPGIPADDLPHLFQKFYRVDNSATRTIGGTGLGLFICRKIVELYSGRIWATSELGKGSTFYIHLPRLPSAKAAELQAAEAATMPITAKPASL